MPPPNSPKPIEPVTDQTLGDSDQLANDATRVDAGADVAQQTMVELESSADDGRTMVAPDDSSGSTDRNEPATMIAPEPDAVGQTMVDPDSIAADGVTAIAPNADESAAPQSHHEATRVDEKSDPMQTLVEMPGTSDESDFGQRSTRGAVPVTPWQPPPADPLETRIDTAASREASEFSDSRSTPTGNKARESRGGVAGMARSEDRYRLLDNFAHGGLGNIWRAEDRSIHREVAYKELLPKALRNKAVVERFLEEAQITGQLEHPGIVPIYDLGYQENGTPYYAMKLLRGGNMEKAIEAMHALPRDSSERHLASTKLLRQFVSVCQAVGFAHEKGVLHRDLKPLNVMIGEFGETLVLDWGLAKLFDILAEETANAPTLEAAAGRDQKNTNEATVIEASPTDSSQGVAGAPQIQPMTRGPAVTDGRSQSATAASVNAATATGATASGNTQTARTEAGTWFKKQVTTDARTAGSQTIMGQVMGTPAYMPPEQAMGLIDDLDSRSDIYSLGGILYKLLTNQQPVSRGKVGEVLKMVAEGRIKPPRAIDATIPKPLEAICRKAMSPRKPDRYSKALDLAADVEAWLSDEPVSCFPEPFHQRAWRWIKRHRTLAISTSAVLSVLVLGSFAWNQLEARRIAGLRSGARSKVADARSALEAAEFSKANTLLTEALGQVQSEANLSAEKTDIENQLADVQRLQAAAERERVANVRTKAEQRLTEAQASIDDKSDWQRAQVLLTEVVTLLNPETALSELRQQAQARLNAVNQELSQRGELDAARARLAQFDDAVEQARVFGGRIAGETSIDDLREAQRQALAAIDQFTFDADRAEQVDPRLKLLGDAAIEQWRAGVFEALVTLARIEPRLATQNDPEQWQAAARSGLKRLKQAEQIGLTSQPVWFLRADLHAALGELDERRQALATADTLQPKTRLDHFLLGERSRDQQKFDEALGHYHDALRVDPSDFWSLNMAGLCHLQSARFPAAVASYTACIARRPNFVWPYLSRGMAFASFQQFANAHRDFDKVLELEPQSYFAHLNRGVVLVWQKKYGDSRTEFETAAKLKPELVAPIINLAEVARLFANDLLLSADADGPVRAAAEYQKALAGYVAAAKLTPQQPSIYYFRGLTHAALNDPVQAFADFERAVALETVPRLQAGSHKEIGRIHQRAGRLPQAVAAFDKSLAANPADYEVVRERSQVLSDLGENDEAISGFTTFLEKSGPIGDVFRARGLAFAKVKKYREAINDYTMSLQYEPSPNMLTRRGWAYLNEAAKLAKEDFQEAQRLNPQNPDTHQGLAFAMVTLGDHAGAVVENEKGIAAAKRAVAQYGPQGWPLLFNPATTYAQAYGKVLADSKLTPERRDELATQYVARAVELLQEAHRLAGPQHREPFVEALRTDTALDPIRQRAEVLDAWKTLDPAAKK